MTEATSKPLDVLIVSAGVGAGHNQAAKAILEGLQAAAPDVSAETLDVLTILPTSFRRFYAGGFALMVSHMPWLYGFGYWLTNRPQRPGRSMGETVRLWDERRKCRPLVEYLMLRRPRLIVNTHFISAQVVAHLRQTRQLQAPHFLVVTDYEVHRWWYCQSMDRCFVPAGQGADRIASWGVPRESLVVAGLPIQPKWTAPLDRDAILRDWKLPAGKDIIVLTGGTNFVCGPVVKIARDVVNACPDATLVVMAGRNKKLLAELSQLEQAGKRLVPVGFTDRGHELLEVASLMITKAGGVTTTECIAKGTPMLLLKPVPGQEKGNAEYFAAQGAACITHRAREVAPTAAMLIHDRPRLAKMAQNARRLYQPATETIVKSIMETL